MAEDTFLSTILPEQESRRATFLLRARRAAKELAALNGDVTVDEVRAACPPPEGVDPRIMGCVFHERHADGARIWQAVGYVKSARKACHHRPVMRFRRIG